MLTLVSALGQENSRLPGERGGMGRFSPEPFCRLPPDEWTLSQRQEIVVPVAVCVSSNVRRFARRANHTDIGSLSRAGVENEKRVRTRIDARDHLLACPFPPDVWIPQLSDVFVGTQRMGLCDARYLNVCHLVRLFGVRKLLEFGEAVIYSVTEAYTAKGLRHRRL
jgi:hypothetical protein